MRRRDAIILGGLIAGAIAVPPILRRLPSEFEFEPIDGAKGFRRLTSVGAVSGGVDPFFGLSERLPDQAPLKEEESLDLCVALFGPLGAQTADLPVAIFTDGNCPHCKTIEKRLIELRTSGIGIRLIWHELPLLGSYSMRVARAALAARFLGAEDKARAYLASHGLPPGGVGLRRMAEALDLLPDMVLREEKSLRVSKALSEDMQLGQRLGIFATPGTVIGRTLVIGAINVRDLVQLIELEKSEPLSRCT